MTVLDILADLDVSQLQDVGGRLLHAIYLTKERLDITESLANDANGVKYLTLSDKYKKCIKQQTKLANINSIDGLRIIRLEKKKSSPGFAEFFDPEILEETTHRPNGSNLSFL